MPLMLAMATMLMMMVNRMMMVDGGGCGHDEWYCFAAIAAMQED
jgi:hypothetical protein